MKHKQWKADLSKLKQQAKFIEQALKTDRTIQCKYLPDPDAEWQDITMNDNHYDIDRFQHNDFDFRKFEYRF